MFSRISWVIVAVLANSLSACATDLRARYHFEPNEAYRTNEELGKAELMIRCTDEDDPKKCQFEDETLIVDLELTNRAPLLLLTNETDEAIVVHLKDARFIVRGSEPQKIERIDTSDTPETIEIPPREGVELRINVEEAWEERCEDVADYEGPTRPGEGSVFGTNTPAKQKTGAPVLSGCFQYPKPFVPEDVVPKDRTKSTLSPAQQRSALEAYAGSVIQLVLPVEVADERFDYVVAYSAERPEIK